MSGRPFSRPQWSAGALAAQVLQRSGGRLAAELRGDAATPVLGTAPLETAGANDLSFLVNPRYRAAATVSAAGVLVIGGDNADALFPQGRAGVLVVSAAPYAWFAFAAQCLAPVLDVPAGIDPHAVVHPDAHVDPSAQVAAGAVVEAGARIGAGAHVGAGASIGAGVRIGARTRIGPRAVFAHGCSIGCDGIVHAGAVIGADGFGFAWFDGRWVKIPQTGAVVIGDDVEIGANSTIDRGAMGDTVIEDGVKIDNQVQIAHNCRIGAHTAIAGCVGIAGSTVIGRNCQLGGAAMLAGHLRIADGVVISGGTVASNDITEPGFYSGVFPIMRNRDWERNAAVLRHLADLRQRLRRIEATLAAAPSLADPAAEEGAAAGGPPGTSTAHR
jgi:UDP-3-O-[3-hydroxymyristoyl] glucosamine N-acyltransferase